MNELFPAAQEKSFLIFDWMKDGKYVTITSGEHVGKKGMIVGVVQPPHKYPMMDHPGDPPLPYVVVKWPVIIDKEISTVIGETFKYQVGGFADDNHQVADIILYQGDGHGSYV